MNYSLLTRLTGLLLVAGFFISCSTTQKTNLQSLKSDGSYAKALEETERRIQNTPDDPSLYILKGELHALKGREESPEKRSDDYTASVQAFDNARNYDASSAQLNRIDSLQQQFWKTEHNAGLRISEDESLSDRYEAAIIHFNNALIFRHDALSTLNNLAVAYFETAQPDRAINSFEKLIELSEEVSPEVYENTAYLYLENGNPEAAIRYFELAGAGTDDNFNLSYGLINAHISAGNHQAAADLLKPLTEQNPDNADLRNVYGTQLYRITDSIMTDLTDTLQKDDPQMSEQIIFEAEGMGELAETELVEAYKRDTLNTDYLQSLAVFYNNLAARYFQAAEAAPQQFKDRLNSKGTELVNFALRYYTILEEQYPANDDYPARIGTLNNLKQNRSN